MPDTINPAHYQGFSNGAQVIDISENLTPNAAQAVQYIGRSSRLDGNNKGNTLEDLRKAHWFIDREISRLKAVQPAADEKVRAQLDDWAKYLTSDLFQAAGLPHQWLLGTEQKPEPREFDSLLDLPHGVIFRDMDGDEWRRDSDDVLTWRDSGTFSWDTWDCHTIEDDESYGPFIEVIESEAL
ncbi:hypothetical protein [Nocardia terpenica]|uniref:hypothetical protein n=1 Tax=Nocardia terpenica TaxID=455432 RepID=UPI00031533B4|nr:hypothetical protein [Nocardia terpenica]